MPYQLSLRGTPICLPDEAKAEFVLCKERPLIIIPLWPCNHWITMVLMDDGRLLIADSAASERVLPDIHAAIATLSKFARKKLSPLVIEVRKQPRNSNIFCVHLIVNAFALMNEWLSPCRSVISYNDNIGFRKVECASHLANTITWRFLMWIPASWWMLLKPFTRKRCLLGRSVRWSLLLFLETNTADSVTVEDDAARETTPQPNTPKQGNNSNYDVYQKPLSRRIMGVSLQKKRNSPRAHPTSTLAVIVAARLIVATAATC